MRTSASNPEHSLRPPRLNGRYVVTRLLGKGAQARVYLAYDARLKQWRAVKVLAANYVSDEHVRQRFETEAEAMAKLSHRNLLRVVDIDSDGGTPFIVMELARGGAVTDWLKRHGVMPAKMACSVILQACEGLAHAHALGVVHRDVKPHNLLIADDGRILLTDFGIAQISEGASMTQTGSVMGTFAYMAPEQRNDAKSVDGRADVYSLGASLYTILTLKTSAELFFAEARDEILEPVPEPLRDVILDACRYDRAERLPSVEALRDRLVDALELIVEQNAPPLTDQVLPLPDAPPLMLPADSGVEDLQKALALRDVDAPTYVPRGRLDQLLEEQSTTLYSDTGFEDQPTQMPYRMPEPRGPVSRLPIEDLSEEELPAYVDVSTLDRRPSPPTAPRAHETVIAPPTPRKVEAASLQSEESGPPVAPGAWWEELDVRWVGGGMAAVLALLMAFAGWGLIDKVLASYTYAQATSELIAYTEEQHTVIQALSQVGVNADELNERWFAFEDAPAHQKAAHAAEFAEAVGRAVEQVELSNTVVDTQAKQLRAKRRQWLRAIDGVNAARQSTAGWLTGDLGISSP